MVHRLAKIGFCVVVFIGAAGVAHAAKDVVVTTSGDRLVGEIKGVEKDVLTLSTDYSDADFKIKWDKIASIESDRQFLVESFDGKRVSGPLKASAPTKSVVVADANVPLPEVALVQPFERTSGRGSTRRSISGTASPRPTPPSSCRSAATSPTATSATWTRFSSMSSGARRPTRRRRNAGISATISAICWARAGT